MDTGADQAPPPPPPPPVAAASAAADEPRDLRVVREILHSLGLREGDYEEAAVHKLLLFAHRYAGDVLGEAKAYAGHAGRESLQADDVRLAIQARGMSSAAPPSREYLYTDKIEEKKELIKGITLGDKEKFQLTPLPQEVLVLWGEHDQIFPIEKAFEVARQLGANARLEIIKNTGHMPQEEDPKRFNEALLNFLLPAPNSSFKASILSRDDGRSCPAPDRQALLARVVIEYALLGCGGVKRRDAFADMICCTGRYWYRASSFLAVAASKSLSFPAAAQSNKGTLAARERIKSGSGAREKKGNGGGVGEETSPAAEEEQVRRRKRNTAAVARKRNTAAAAKIIQLR
uniref:AB hydrolase-1 domain-containing protein n=1 Tax=Oryza nivara TaxID=4536 RepID=A0A0E0I3J6_ORYNI